jgi:hypothetical protein
MFLVKNSDDVDVARFVLANLAEAPNDPRETFNKDTCAGSIYANTRSEARRVLVQLCLLNNTGQGTYQYTSQAVNARQSYQIGRFTTSHDLVDFGAAINKREADGLQRLQKEFIKTQLPILMRQQQKQQQEMASVWRYVTKLENETLIRKVKDPDPLVSFLAIQVAGKKRLPVEKQCIGLLSSMNPNIRQAARQTLIRLGRGVDFGPEPTAGPPQIAASVRSWASWASIQTEEPIQEVERRPPPVIAKQIPAKPENRAIELEEPLVGRRTGADTPVRVVVMARPPKTTAQPDVEWTELVRKVEPAPQQQESPDDEPTAESPPSFALADTSVWLAAVVLGVTIFTIGIRLFVGRRRTIALPPAPVLSGKPSREEGTVEDRPWWADQPSPFAHPPTKPPPDKRPWWVDQPSPFEPGR